ncbi:MAG: tetratricopeptide repeat protein [Deltaproteobacteria bacterium]|nr:tetratricopeptide repeat protein [Deltaproteobacteria bacterium]MBN2674797.1 tetratricopeptide repeat protein [Deltaproteobacteria bacterium]
MKYRCNHCDIMFESDKKDKVRCPECMGIHDVEPAKESSPQSKPEKGKSPFFVPASILLLVVAVAIVYFALEKQKAPAGGDAGVNPKSVKEQIEALGIEMSDAVVPFEQNDSIAAFAKDAAAGESGLKAVQAIAKKLADMKDAKKWQSFNQMEPRNEGPMTASELLDKINSDETVAATSYEITCLLFAATGALDVKSLQMVEILYYNKEKTPADPSAIYSRYAVVSENTLIDAWAGREEKAADVNMIPLDAAAATAPFYAHRSLSKFAKLDMAEALKDNKTAVELAPDNATFKIHRGKIFLGSSAIQEAVAEFEKAKKTRDWALTKVALAQVSLMTQSNVSDAEADIRDALQQFPSYHQAHALLAAMYMMRGDADSAEQELKIAEKISSASPEVAATFAQLFAMKGETERAIEYAKKAVRLSKENFQSLMILAQVYRATARFDEMRETARQAMEKAPSEAVKEELKAAFNLTEDDLADGGDDAVSADDDSDDEDVDLDLPAAPAPGDLKLNLKNENRALGGGNLRLGGGNNRPGLGGGSLQLEMNNQ